MDAFQAGKTTPYKGVDKENVHATWRADVLVGAAVVGKARTDGRLFVFASRFFLAVSLYF